MIDSAQDLVRMLGGVVGAVKTDIHVSYPGTVRSYNVGAQTAQIELGSRRIVRAEDPDEEEDTSEPMPILVDVPVVWPRAGGYFLHWPLGAGDTVDVVFSTSDLGAWRESGGSPAPGVDLLHGLSGAKAYPGLHLRSNPCADADGTYGRVGREGGAYIEFRPSEIRAGGSDALALAAALELHLKAIQTMLTTLGAAHAPTIPNTYDHDALRLIPASEYHSAVLKGE